jgi:hypothetical protein
VYKVTRPFVAHPGYACLVVDFYNEHDSTAVSIALVQHVSGPKFSCMSATPQFSCEIRIVNGVAAVHQVKLAFEKAHPVIIKNCGFAAVLSGLGHARS